MIPKVINYCWFGHGVKSETVNQCISSWKKYCPDFQIIEWNESNYDIENNNDYVKEAAKMEKWAFVTDYARLDIVENNGGIYLDTDVELIASLDPLLKNDSFFGLESSRRVNTGLGFGSKKHAEILRQMKNEYHGRRFIRKNGKMDLTTCVEIGTNVFLRHGLSNKNEVQDLVVSDEIVTVYSSEYFCPQKFREKTEKITDKTISIHHFNGTWKNTHERLKTTFKWIARKCMDKLFGVGAYDELKKMIKRSYMFKN